MNSLAYFYPHNHEQHYERGHPERPDRIEAIVAALDEAGLWDPHPKLTPLEIPQAVLEGVHTRRHLATIEEASRRGLRIDADTYLTEQSWPLALQAAGGACSVASAVWQRSAGAGFALCRPPGHHATPQHAMGFCLINNIAVASEYLLQELGAERLAIVDVDLHHGNGTQDIFYERGEVLFVSTHQHPLYPGTGMLSETGRGDGEMATLNLPLPPYSGDTAFDAAVGEVILPALQRFEPEMLLVSAGVDAHWRDPLGYLMLSAAGYHQTVAALKGFADVHCGGRIALFLEGGYDLEGGSACAAGAAAALLGQAFEDPIGKASSTETENWRTVITQAAAIHDIR